MRISFPPLDRLKIFGFLLIAVINIIAYSPSFQHLPRADHIFYLADMAGKNDWWTLAVKSYDFTRTRTFAAGDGSIFRPGACFLLGTEKSLFGYDFVWWQVTGVVLHLLVIWFLLDLLLTIERSSAAVWLTGFFSLAYCNHELVIWHHVNSILLVIILILASLRQIYLYTERGYRQGWRIGLVFAWMLAACFTYEVANAFTVIFAVYLWIDTKRTKSKPWPVYLVAAAAGIYIFASYWQYLQIKDDVVEYGILSGRLNGLTILQYLFLANSWWLYSGLFPTQYEITYVQGRAVLGDQTTLLKALHFADPVVWLGLGLIVCSLGVWIGSLTTSFFKKRLRFLTMMFAMIISWGLVIVLYRVGNRGLTFALGGTLHYNYVFWVLFFVFSYVAVDWARIQSWRGKTGKTVFVMMLVAFSIINGVLVFKANKNLASSQKQSRQLVRTVESLIRQVGSKPGFSFFVHPDFPGNYLIPNQLREDDPVYKRYSYIELLYLNYFDSEKPLFIFLPGEGGQTARVIPAKR